METKELQLSISIPFSYTNKMDELSGITLIRRPERTLVYHYVLALCREIESLAGDLDEVSLCAIRFIGGNIHFLWKDDLEKTRSFIFGPPAVPSGSRKASADSLR